MSLLCSFGWHRWKLMTGGTRAGVRLVFWSICRGCGMTRMRKGRP